MRLLLSDLLQQNQGIDPSQIKNLIPDVYKVDIRTWDQNPVTAIWPRIIKTHEFYNPAYHRIIYIFRHPADCLYSYYRYISALNLTQSRPIPDLLGFYKTYLPQWVNHVESYLQFVADLSKHPTTGGRIPVDRIQFVAYEDLHSNPAAVLHHLVQFINLPIELDQIQQAIDRQAFTQVKQRAICSETEALGFWEDIPMVDFFRQGQVGRSQIELPASVLSQIEIIGLATYQRARKLCQTSVNPARFNLSKCLAQMCKRIFSK